MKYVFTMMYGFVGVVFAFLCFVSITHVEPGWLTGFNSMLTGIASGICFFNMTECYDRQM